MLFMKIFGLVVYVVVGIYAIIALADDWMDTHEVIKHSDIVLGLILLSGWATVFIYFVSRL